MNRRETTRSLSFAGGLSLLASAPSLAGVLASKSDAIYAQALRGTAPVKIRGVKKDPHGAANARIHLIAIGPSLLCALHAFSRGGVTTRFSRDTRPQVQKSMRPAFRGGRSRFLSADLFMWTDTV